MSRSYRKPYFTEGYGNKDKPKRKRSASRAVRATEEVASGAAYKKQFNPWDICDFKIYAPNTKARRK